MIQFISINLQSEQNIWMGENSVILMPLVRNSSVQKCSISTKLSQESGYYLENVESHVHTVATFMYSTLSVATSSFSSMVDVEPPITRTCICILHSISANCNWPIYCGQHIMKCIKSWPKLGSLWVQINEELNLVATGFLPSVQRWWWLSWKLLVHDCHQCHVPTAMLGQMP